MNKDKVTHIGIVTGVATGRITVRTEEAPKCDGCAVAALCNKAPDSDGKGGEEVEILTIDTPQAASFSPGDRVRVQASSGSTLWASWWSLILPTILFIATLLGVQLRWPGASGWSIAAAFAVLGIYALALYLFRARLSAGMQWTVQRI